MSVNMMRFARTLLVVLLCSAVVHVGALICIATFGNSTLSLDEVDLDNRVHQSPAIFVNMTRLE